MKIIGEQFLPAPRLRVWELLTDPTRWPDLLPGCRSCIPVGPNQLAIQISSDNPAPATVYDGRVRLCAPRLPEHCELSFECRNHDGEMRGAGLLDLFNEGPQTRVRYSAELQVSGALMQLGQRAIDDLTKRLLEEIFARAEAQLGSPAARLRQAQGLAINFVRYLRDRLRR